MQCGVRHDHPADSDRLQPCHRGERAGTADLYVDGVEHGLGLFRGKFMGKGPSRRARHLSQPVLEIMPVDLVDDAVDVIAEIRPRGADGCVLFKKSGDIRASVRQRIDAEAHVTKRGKAAHMGVGKRGACLAQRIGENPQSPRGGNRRVLLAKRSGSGIARIGEYLGAGRFLRRVQRQEIRLVHIELAAHLKHLRR